MVLFGTMMASHNPSTESTGGSPGTGSSGGTPTSVESMPSACKKIRGQEHKGRRDSVHSHQSAMEMKPLNVPPRTAGGR